MERRDFLRTAGGATAVGVAGGTATAAPAVAQTDGNESGGNESGDGNETDGEQSGEGQSATGGTKEVVAGPGGDPKFEPKEVTVPPGTTIKWSWESDNHNIVVESQPDEANWEGTEGPASKTYDTGHSYQHTFETTGTYEYFCDPHKQLGMVGTIEVEEGASLDEGGGGAEGGEKEPKEMGVPFRAHYVGIGAILATAITLVFTFFQLKYGESPNASGGGN